MRILLIDDNAKNRAGAKDLLGDKHKLVILDTYVEARDMLTSGQRFDVVLVDLMLPVVPAVGMNLSLEAVEKYHGQEMPLGLTLAFLALKLGYKKVGIVTNTNHHDHPMSAALDILSGMDGSKVTPFGIGDARIVFCNIPVRKNFEIKCKAWLPVLKALQTNKSVPVGK